MGSGSQSSVSIVSSSEVSASPHLSRSFIAATIVDCITVPLLDGIEGKVSACQRSLFCFPNTVRSLYCLRGRTWSASPHSRPYGLPRWVCHRRLTRSRSHQLHLLPFSVLPTPAAWMNEELWQSTLETKSLRCPGGIAVRPFEYFLRRDGKRGTTRKLLRVLYGRLAS